MFQTCLSASVPIARTPPLSEGPTRLKPPTIPRVPSRPEVDRPAQQPGRFINRANFTPSSLHWQRSPQREEEETRLPQKQETNLKTCTHHRLTQLLFSSTRQDHAPHRPNEAGGAGALIGHTRADKPRQAGPRSQQRVQRGTSAGVTFSHRRSSMPPRFEAGLARTFPLFLSLFPSRSVVSIPLPAWIFDVMQPYLPSTVDAFASGCRGTDDDRWRYWVDGGCVC
jgi:hypothetical protein